VGETLDSFNRRGWAENAETKARLADEKAVRDILYGIENLRKRAGAED